MLLALLCLLAAVPVGLLVGGTLEALGRLRLSGVALVAGALALQLVGAVVGGPVHPVALVLSAALVMAFLARSRGVRGLGLVALGLLANALVVTLNGAMPVSQTASARAGTPPAQLEALATGQDPRHELRDASTRLPWLGDVVPVALPGRGEVVSPGDVLVGAGLAQLVVVAMRGRPARRVPPLRVRLPPGSPPSTRR